MASSVTPKLWLLRSPETDVMSTRSLGGLLSPFFMSDTTTRWDEHTKKLVFATKAKGLSPADQALFEAVCISSGLDPLRNEVYAVTRGGKMSIQTGIDGYLKLANQTKELNGMEVLFYDEEGNESEVWLKKTPPVACLVRVYRKGAQFPFTASCRFDAYKQGGQMWTKFPETMLAKATTTLALRRGFADVIAGIASADEMDQAGMAAPEALTQGTPAAAAPASAPAKPAKVAAKKVVDPVAAEIAAENLAKATGGKVTEEPSASTPEPAKKEEAPAADAKASELPERDDLKGAVAALYKQARISKVTTTGWATLEKQCGGEITTAMAAKALPALKDETKVGYLNAGKSTQGVAV